MGCFFPVRHLPLVISPLTPNWLRISVVAASCCKEYLKAAMNHVPPVGYSLSAWKNGAPAGLFHFNRCHGYCGWIQ